MPMISANTDIIIIIIIIQNGRVYLLNKEWNKWLKQNNAHTSNKKKKEVYKSDNNKLRE